MLTRNGTSTQKILPLEIRAECELWIDERIQEGVNLFSDPESLCKELKLKVKEKSTGPRTVFATLQHSEDENYVAEILIKSTLDYAKRKYAILHEVVRYLRLREQDKKISGKHTYNPTSRGFSRFEAILKYTTDSIIMPWRSVLDDILQYRRMRPHVDELAFIKSCGKKYGENITIASRSRYIVRMKEVAELTKIHSFAESVRTRIKHM